VDDQMLLRLDSVFVMTTGALLCRRDALIGVGAFDEALPAFQDCDLCIRLSAVSEMACVQESLLLVHDSAHWTRIGSDLRNVLEGTGRCLAKQSSDVRRAPVALAGWRPVASVP